MKATLASAEWIPAAQRPVFGEVTITPPSVTFASSIELHVDDRLVTLRHLGRGHTDNDVAAYVDDVCFAGDLIEEGAPPSFGDSYPDDWITTLDALMDDLPPIVVPGHGDVVDVDFVRTQRDQIAAAIRNLREGAGSAPWSEAVMASLAERLG